MAEALTRCQRCKRLHNPHCMVVTNANDEPAMVVTEPVQATMVVTRHGKYKDPEARKAYQREHMRKLRAKA